MSAHPDDTRLRAFALGKLDDRAAALVQDHLNSCPDCRRKVTENCDDSFVDRVRAAAGRERKSEPPDAVEDPIGREEEGRPGSQPDALLPPELAGLTGYEVVRELGHGGMGVVYLARNKLIDRPEVLKVMNKALIGRPASVERFLQEIRSSGRLSHPNVAITHSAHQIGDLLVLAMEYVEGDDLAKIVRTRGPLPIANACFCVHQAALGLQRGHELGMVHRDIKPGNILLSRQGKRLVVKIIDFGLAKAKSEVSTDHELTGTNQMMGTAGYSAPEQLIDAKTADIRSDIYALGTTLYYLLSGEPPYQGASALAVAMAQETGAARPVREIRPEVPEALAAVVARMMAKDPAERYQQPAEVAAALVPYIKSAKEARGSVAAPQSATEFTSRPAEENARARSVAISPQTLLPNKSTSPATRRPANSRIWWLAIPIAAALLCGVIALGAAALYKVRAPKGASIVNEDVVPDTQLRPIRPDAEHLAADGGAKTVKPLERSRQTPGAPPQRLACTGTGGASASAVQRAQAEWAKFLGREPAETAKVAGMEMTFILVPPGKFRMGSAQNEKWRGADEIQHEASITRPFYLGKYSVTRGQFRRFVEDTGYSTEAESGVKGARGWDARSAGWKQGPQFTWMNAGFAQTDEHPVVNVSWNDAVRYANWLGRKDGRTYRLPTEAEWEYACRAGTTSRFYFGDNDEDFARYGNVADARLRRATGQDRGIRADDGYAYTAPVGQFQPNGFGLYDMSGNVWQWCTDWYASYPPGPNTDPTGPAEGTLRVFRGGGWGDDAGSCRSAVRRRIEPGLWGNNQGFRLLQAPPAAQ
jgi:formylglycine-generating enzyme required for sulfatase activity/serine/threonine protein kinase